MQGNEGTSLYYLEAKTFSNDDIKDAHLIYAATNQHAVNMMVKQAAHDFQWVNVVSDGTESSFHTPGVIRNGEYVVTISTSGKDPSFTKRMKQELTSIFPTLIKSFLVLTNYNLFLS